MSRKMHVCIPSTVFVFYRPIGQRNFESGLHQYLSVLRRSPECVRSCGLREANSPTEASMVWARQEGGGDVNGEG